MTGVFGAVAAMYDDVRPGYPEAVADAIVEFHGGRPGSVVEIGAGTGKGTELLVRLTGAITCVEPDPAMAAVLSGKFPQATVVRQAFEEWSGPGADVLACALAWHWLDPASRNRRARAALAPAGTLAVFGHTYGLLPEVTRVLRGVDPAVQPRAEHWVRDDVAGSGVWSHVEEREWHRRPEFGRADFLRLMQTFGPFRKRPDDQQRAVLAGLDAVLPERVAIDLTTTLVLARG